MGDLLFVGRATLAKLNRIGINTIGDLANSDIDYISKYLGKIGENLWFYANGKDDAPVMKSDEESEIKSVGNSVTCYRDLVNNDDVAIMLSSLCESVSERLMDYDVGKARSVSVSVRDSDLNWFTRQTKLPHASVLSDDFFKVAMKLFKDNYDWKSTVRSLGVAAFDFCDDEQITLDASADDYDKRLKLMQTVSKIRDKYGVTSVRRGLSYIDKKLTKEGEGGGGSLPPARK